MNDDDDKKKHTKSKIRSVGVGKPERLVADKTNDSGEGQHTAKATKKVTDTTLAMRNWKALFADAIARRGRQYVFPVLFETALDLIIVEAAGLTRS